MRDISMHVLDLAMNSIHAKASLIEISIDEQKDSIRLMIKDNGTGMSSEVLKKVLDPFFTTRKTRKVGLGLSLLYANVKQTNGKFHIVSEVGSGTSLEVVFDKTHIDCLPMGDIDETIITLIILEPEIDYLYKYKLDNNEFLLDTRLVKSVLREVPINEGSVIEWLKENLNYKFD